LTIFFEQTPILFVYEFLSLVQERLKPKLIISPQYLHFLLWYDKSQ